MMTLLFSPANSFDIMSCHAICHVMSGYVTSCHAMPHHATSHVMSSHVILCHVMSCCVVSCHIVSYHVMPCHIMLCHVTYTAATLFPCDHSSYIHCILAGLQILSCKHG